MQQSIISGRGDIICGTLWSWGDSDDGSLGNNAHDPIVNRPTQVGSLTDWAKVTACQSSLAIKTDGTLWGWGGENNEGQIGINSTSRASSPTQVGSDTDWDSCYGIRDAAIFKKTDGSLWSVGQGTGVGDGQTANRSNPVQIGSELTWGVIPTGYGSRAFTTK